MVQRHRVADFLWRRSDQPTTTRRVRAYRARPAYEPPAPQATVEVRVAAAALAAAVHRLGGRLYSPKQPGEPLALEPAVWAYRSAYLVERSLGRLQGRPLSLTPMSVPRDDHATGLRRWWSMALRVLTLVAFVVRRPLAAEGATFAGLSAGHAQRETARPTAERWREAFQEVTLTVVEGGHQAYRHLTALSPLQERMLARLGFSSRVYTRLCTVSHEPL